MSGWIKVEKDLANDPRVLRMAAQLRHADVTLSSRCRLVVVGALVTLWWYADTHIGDDDVLGIGADQIDELVGIAGFCKLMPGDWLQIIDENSVKLIDYTGHNGSLAKNKALAQRRQQRHRKNSSETRSCHADVTQGALPDKTRQDIDEDKREEAPRALASVKSPAAEMSVALRNLGVTVTVDNPTLRQWVTDGYTTQQVTDAARLARERKPHPEPIPANYVNTILRAPQRAPPQRPKGAWDRLMEANADD